MALPVVVFNSSTGSDTQASGAGPSTALFGTGAETDGTTTIDLSADSPTLTGVATDGSAVIWVDTATGRQFCKITAVDNGLKTVTVANAPSASAAGLTWAIGGKRATFNNVDSRKLFTADVLPGWIIETETDQTLTSALSISISGDTTTGPVTVRGNASPRPIVTQQGSGGANYCFHVNNRTYITIQGFQTKQSGATKAAAIRVDASTISAVRIIDCILGDASGGSNHAYGVFTADNNPRVEIIDCEIRYCTVNGVHGGRGSVYVINTAIHHCTGDGISLTDGADNGLFVIDGCLVYENGSEGMTIPSTGISLWVKNCTIHDNGSHGLEFSTAFQRNLIVGNQITGNGGYGMTAPSSINTPYIRNNNFGTGALANTSGAASSTITLDSTNLTVDPEYTDAAGGDFSIGTPTKAEGYPDVARTIGANESGTTSYVDIGAAQRQEAGGGSGGGLPVIGNAGTVIRGVAL